MEQSIDLPGRRSVWKRWCGLLLALVATFTVSAFGADVASPRLVLDSSRDLYLLGPHTEVLRDPGGQLTIAEVASPTYASSFTRDGRERPNFGFTHSAFWFRFTISNHSTTSLWYLDATREWVEQVALYQQDGKGAWTVIHAGTDRPFSGRLIPNERPVLPLVVEPGRSEIFYLRLKNSASLAMVGELVKPELFASQDDVFRLQYGAYYGALLIMGVYNFLVFLSVRDRSYGYLALLLLTILALEASSHGHLYRYLDRPITTAPGAVALGLMGVAFVLLTRTFLRTGRHTPLLDVGLKAAGALSAAAGALALVSDHAMMLGFAVVSPIATLCVIAAAIRWREGFAPAGYFSLALLAFILPGQVVVAQYFGLVPPNLLSEYGTHIGVILMACLFSFAIGDHIRRMHRVADSFVPIALIRQLGRESLAEVQLGDSADMEVTVLFSDIRSFTTLSEKLSPRESFDFVNSYLAFAAPAVQSSGGIIDKYIGDAIMAVFPGDAVLALDAADRLLDATRRFNQAVAGRYPEVKIGIGLHRGHVRMGTIGDGLRMNATVIGDTVNTASRIESLNKEYETTVLASADFVAALGEQGRGRFEVVQQMTIRGKGQAVTVYRLSDGGSPAEPVETEALVPAGP